MMFELMLVLGVGFLGFALRSYGHPTVFRLGSLMIVATSFLVGWLLLGSVWIGVAFVLSWLLLPWVEILTRLRHLRLPLDRILESKPPPSRAAFPAFEDLSQEVESEGFEHVTDVGWEDEQSRQFYRVFRHADSRTQAAICLAEQGELAFYYLSLTSRAPSGRVLLTWNYPFCYGLKFSPGMDLNRVESRSSFAELAASHKSFVRERGFADGVLEPVDPKHVVEGMQRDFRAQVRHNLDLGLLRQEGEAAIRYTARGMFFLWFQFLRDLIRIL